MAAANDGSSVRRKEILLERMVAGVDMVKLGVFGRLSQRFKAAYGEGKADVLAAAVTNELFSEPPCSPDGERFAMSNRDIVQRELLSLRGEEEIRRAVTQAVRVKAMVSCAKDGRAAESSLDALEKLRKRGILVPAGEAPSPHTFLPTALEFYESIDRETRPEGGTSRE